MSHIRLPGITYREAGGRADVTGRSGKITAVNPEPAAYTPGLR